MVGEACQLSKICETASVSAQIPGNSEDREEKQQLHNQLAILSELSLWKLLC